jgi:tetratricopeptide (TPR) repeat protein
MSQGLHLGGRWYTQELDLGVATASCSWQVLRDENDGSRWLIQRWSPRPSDRELDQIREVYLQRFTDAEPMDPVSARFGFDESQAWFLQKLMGTTFTEVWPQWNADLKEAFLQRFQKALRTSFHPKLLHPEVISLQSGRFLVPRVMGEAPRSWKDFEDSLDKKPGERSEPRPWELPPDLSSEVAQPIRGRGQVLTYLKSLMFGLSTPSPMERIVVLQGEEGMGLSRLGEWAAAAAETESIWVRCIEIQPDEKAGAFLGRMLQGLLKGFEADLYARSPETARALARRLSTFTFLRGGLRLVPEAPVEPGEIKAALKILEFASEMHPRMLQILRLERADAELQAILAELVLSSNIAWFLSVTLSETGNQAKTLLSPLRNHHSVSFVHLDRLEDHELLDLLDDLLNPNSLSQEFRAEVCQVSLGNPGLLRSILENAQMEGSLFWQPEQGWSPAPDRPVHIKVQEDMEGKVLVGRMHRLTSASAAVLRLLAIADQAMEFSVLGAALGIAGDPLDDALRLAISSKLILAKDGLARLSSHKVRNLALEGVPEAEVRRLAKSLLKALGDGGSPVLSVHLESIASDEQTALDRVLRMVELEAVPRPVDAEEVVQLTLGLHPTAAQEARLWEFLADAWSQATIRGRIPPGPRQDRSPFEFALEAIDKAKAALGIADEPALPEHRELLARLFRKEAFLQIRVRDLSKALRAVQSAAECLIDQPLHLEQPQLRLALGRIHLLQGYTSKGIKAVEEGLQLVASDGPASGHRDQVALLLELGKAQAQRCQFQRSLATLQAAQRLLEHDQDYRRLASVLNALAQVFLAIGQPDIAYGHLRDALQASRIQDDLELQGRCHLNIGIFKSCQQALSSALSHLDSALDRFQTLHDRIGLCEAKVWKARTLAALGDTAQCDMLLLQALDVPKDQLSASEWGDLLALQGEIAAFRGAWRDAARLYQEAYRGYETAGLLWRERLARLRFLQAQARAAMTAGNREGLDQAWSTLEHFKAQVEGSGSRWLDLEWNRAHALLLSTIPDTGEAVTMESLTALGAMLSAAREMRFPADVLEASALGAALLMHRGESLGARSRLQDAFSCFQDLWSKVPESIEMSFLGRPDIHQFKETVEAAGLRFSLPERVDPLADWTPTQITLPVLKPL